MTEKIRVLQLIKTLDISGAERYSVEIARALPKDRCQVQVCGFFETGSELEKYWQNRLREEGIENFVATPWVGNDQFLSYWKGIQELKRQLRWRPMDVIHSHFQLGTLAALYLRSLGLVRSVVRTAHNHPRTEWSPGWYGDVRRWLIGGWVYPCFVDLETSVSQVISDELRQNPGARWARRPPVTMHSAVSMEAFQYFELAPMMKPEGHYWIGSVGRLTKQKNYSVLLQAMKLVLNRIPQTTLFLIGDGELRSELEQEAKALGIENQVVFLGRRSDVFEQIRQWDLFVLPSLWEGLAAVVIESMACGTPVVATDIPGMRELIEPGQSGWLVNAGDALNLAETILEALQNPELRAKFAKFAFQHAKQFTFPIIAERYAQLYAEVIAK